MVKTVFKLRLFAYRVWRMFIGRIWYAPFFGSFGSRVVLEPPVLVSGPHNIYVGDRTLIRRGARLETVEVHGRTPRLMIGSNCNIEQNVHLVCHSSLTIGNDVSITANCAIVDVTHPYLPISETKIGMRRRLFHRYRIDDFAKCVSGRRMRGGSKFRRNPQLCR
jgi:acetyltransferase-like isoleucine patch superfamily enzyme